VKVGETGNIAGVYPGTDTPEAFCFFGADAGW
jgi:hypothetical protein